jgi:hypothetical protein
MEQLNATTMLRTEPVLAGILALLISDRDARHDSAGARTEALLARAGLNDEEIRALTGTARATPKPLPAWAGTLARKPSGR